MPKITTMNISLPDSMRRYVESRVLRGGYANSSEYVRHLIREEAKRTGVTRLNDLLDEAIASGPGGSPTPEFWANLKARAAKRVSRPRGSRRKAG